MKFSIRYILALSALAALASTAYAANGGRGLFLLGVIAWPTIINQSLCLCRVKSSIKLISIGCSCACFVMFLHAWMTGLGGLWSTFAAAVISLVVAVVFWAPQILIIVIADDILEAGSDVPYESDEPSP